VTRKSSVALASVFRAPLHPALDSLITDLVLILYDDALIYLSNLPDWGLNLLYSTSIDISPSKRFQFRHLRL
jgi:hypothetical protein